MLGGGTFVTEGAKKLPGSYINFVSAARANASLADRGYVAMPIAWDWGVDGEVFTVTNVEFFRKCREYFGYDYMHDKVKVLRDLFCNAETVYFYKLGTGAVKASNEFAEAKYAGTRGNSLKIVVTQVDDEFEVCTYLESSEIDKQTVASASELEDNAFVVFKKDATLTETAGTPLSNGKDGTVDYDAWVKALTALESYSFNIIGITSAEEDVKQYAVKWTDIMRDDVGVKFQTVLCDCEADDKGIINLVSKPVDGAETDLVYWVAGAEASCRVNASCTNMKYDGEFKVSVDLSQQDLIDALDNGKLIFHRVGEDIRILEDINSKVSVSDEENEDFKYNQTIRVIDQIATDIASLFNTRYLGIIPNDEQGRISLWNDIVRHHQELLQLRAIEGFEPDHVVVEKGESKKSVVVTDKITVVNAMAQMFMTCVVA